MKPSSSYRQVPNNLAYVSLRIPKIQSRLLGSGNYVRVLGIAPVIAVKNVQTGGLILRARVCGVDVM